jgi:hypothetical protein
LPRSDDHDWLKSRLKPVSSRGPSRRAAEYSFDMTPRFATASHRHAACLFAGAALTIACPAADEDDGTGTAETTDTSSNPTTSASTTTTADTSGSETTTTTTADTSGTGDSGSSDSGSSDGGSSESSTGEVACGAPIELGVFTPAEGNARGFEVVGDTVYLAVEAGGLAIVDISDPTMPAELGVFDFAPGMLIHRVAHAGDILFVGMRGSGWAAIDITDPADPMFAYLDNTGSAQDLAFADDVLYVADVNGVQVFDVADPLNPVTLVNDLVLPGSTQTVVVAGDYAYAGGLTAGLSVLDISDPAMTSEVTTLDMDGRGYLAIEGDRAFVSASDGVHIVDITDPTQPTELGVFVAERREAVAADDRLWVLGVDTVSQDVPMLTVVDYVDPASPTVVFDVAGDYDTPAWIEVAGGRVLYTEENDDALHILDGCPQ